MNTQTSPTNLDLPSRVVTGWTLAAGLGSLAMGLWGFCWPFGFFEDFPVPGAGWVSTLGDYNEHLVRDFGAAQIGLGLAAAITAFQRSREGTVAILSGFIVFGLLHLGYHLATFHHFSTGSALAQATVLLTFIAIPSGILSTLRKQKGN